MKKTAWTLGGKEVDVTGLLDWGHHSASTEYVTQIRVTKSHFYILTSNMGWYRLSKSGKTLVHGMEHEIPANSDLLSIEVLKDC